MQVLNADLTAGHLRGCGWGRLVQPAECGLGRRRLTEPFAPIPNASLLRQAGYGTARLLVHWFTTVPTRLYIGGVLSVIVVGVGSYPFLGQIGRHPAPLVVSNQNDLSPSNATSPITPVLAAAPPVSPTPALSSNPAAALDMSPVSSTPVSAPLPPPGMGRGERRFAARMPEQIGDLLRRKPVVDDSRLISTAQGALAKLGYPVKVDGAEDGATRRALRDFERAHGLPLRTEINSQLVKQLTAVVRLGQKGQRLVLTTDSSQ